MLEKLNAIVTEIEDTPDRLLRSEILIDFANRFKDVPPEVAVRPFSAEHKAPACQSDAYVWVKRLDDGGIAPFFAVENPQGLSAKALATILTDALTGCDPAEIKTIDERIVPRIFGATISMGKGEGLMGMIRKLKHLAACLG